MEWQKLVQHPIYTGLRFEKIGAHLPDLFDEQAAGRKRL